MILRTTDNNELSPQASKNKTNYDITSTDGSISSCVSSDTYNGNISGNIKNLSTVTNLAKFKKSDLIKSKKRKLTKSKKSDLIKTKILDFAKADFFKTDFLTFKAKKAFIYL